MQRARIYKEGPAMTNPQELEIAIEEFHAAINRAREVYRWADMELRDLSRASSLMGSEVGSVTKDGEARLNFDDKTFADGMSRWLRANEYTEQQEDETEAERRMWAARDSYNMRREGK